MKLRLILSVALLAVTSPIAFANDDCSNKQDTNCNSSGVPVSHGGGWFTSWFSGWRSHSSEDSSRASAPAHDSVGHGESVSHGGFGGEAAGHGGGGE